MLTAARADRTSFGCSDDADFTYFGRAYLQQALNRTASFTDAFFTARGLVRQWETRHHEQHSEPQMAKGALIGAKLEQWQATLAQTGTEASAAAVPPP
ncbi:MAG: C13 family peptidase [Nevskia sp.]|nr:C13 family peptidase [Nevskia sp.]